MRPLRSLDARTMRLLLLSYIGVGLTVAGIVSALSGVSVKESLGVAVLGFTCSLVAFMKREEA